MAKLEDGTEVDDEMVRLAAKLSGNQKTRKPFLKLVKEVDPELPIPEIEVDEVIAKAQAPLLEKIGVLEKQNAESAKLLNIEQRRKPLVDAGLSATEIERVEKVMVEKGIANHATALEFIRNNEKVAAPRQGSSREAFTLPTIVTKEFFKDPNREARKIAGDVLNEIRSAKSA